MLKLRLGRYTVFLLCILALFAGVALRWFWLAGVAGPLVLLGLWNIAQTRHSILRNYPVIGHVRWLAEMIRPEIRQYLLEDEDDAVPFSRAQRSLIYSRAKQQTADHPFGTLVDVYGEGYEYVTHSMRPAAPADPKSFRVTIGGDQCSQPYSASLFNVSAMSFGALSANAIRALNKGAALGGFYHDTGEGSISPYHREMGGDLVWELGSGYFGCRTADGKFDPERFAAQATTPQVKMIEIKLSQGAKPGHGGILPAKKVTREIAETRGVPMGQDCVSPSHHTAFSTPLEMMAFITQLRTLSGGKPVGFKLCVGHPHEFMALVKAMLETGVRPDFIVVDGGEGGTGAAPLEFSDRIGTPMREGLLFVHNVLTGAGLRDEIRLGVAGKIVSAFDLASVLAIGADWANAARGFMFALGCVQSMSCHTNRCPTGVATQDAGRQRALVVPDKAERVASFQANTLRALSDMLAACGLSHRGPNGIEPFPDFHRMLDAGALLDTACPSPFYREEWARAQTGTFAPRG
jgi:glutamate synthase domain-containing protein 2